MDAFNFMSNVFPIIFIVAFLFVFSMFGFVIFSGIKNYRNNNKSPILTVDANVVAKRNDYRQRMRSSNSHSRLGYTLYYATFEVESGDRMELQLQENEYGLLVEGDTGKLKFQGTRFLDFTRETKEFH